MVTKLVAGGPVRDYRTKTDIVQEGVDLLLTCWDYPTQYEGVVDSYEAYYRSRHEVWYFNIVEAGNAIYPDEGVRTFHRCGDGGMDPWEAIKLILPLIPEFRDKGFDPPGLPCGGG